MTIFPNFLKQDRNSIFTKFKWKIFLIFNHFPITLPLDEWSLGIDDYNAIFKTLKQYKKEKEFVFVEIGSGVSTALIPLFLKKQKFNYDFFSIEGDAEWKKQTEILVKKYAPHEEVRINLITCQKKNDSCWYDTTTLSEQLTNFHNIDALLIDGPPGSLCSQARKPAIPFFLPRLKNNSVVFLHDAKRKDEKEIIENWKQYFHSLKINFTKKGLAIFQSKI